MRNRLVLVFFLLVNIWGTSQEMLFENFTTNDGLPSMQVYDMYQDSNGYIWYATDRGIARYNGYEIEDFSLEDGLTCIVVFKFFPQKNGDIWCSTNNNKLFYFNPDDYQFKAYKYNKALSSCAGNWVIDDLILNGDGSISLSYIKPAGIITLNNNGELTSNFNEKLSHEHENHLIIEETVDEQIFGYSLAKTDKELIPQTNGGTILSSILIQKSNYINTCHFGSTSVFSDWDRIYVKNNNELVKVISEGFRPLNIGKLDDNHFWVGYLNNGVAIYNLEGELTERLLTNQSVTYVIHDHENALWISTLNSGVFYNYNAYIKTYKVKNENTVFNLGQDTAKGLWISYYDGMVYHRETNKLNFVLSHPNKGRYMLISYNDNLSELDLCSNSIVFNSKKIAIRGGSYTHIPSLSPTPACDVLNVPRLIRDNANDVCISEKGVFIGTQNGLFFYEIHTDSLTQITRTELNFDIKDIDRRKNTIFVATLGGGVVFINENNTISITKKDGLRSNFVNEIYSENDSTLWVCTNKGLNRISYKNGHYKIAFLGSFSNNDLSDIEIINDTIWVGSKTGLYSFPKSLIDKNEEVKLSFFNLLKVEMNGKVCDTDKLQNLDHDENKLTFHYQAISFIPHKELSYRYKLDESEQKWNYTSELNFTYQSIPPGVHNLTIQVSLGEENWSEKKIKYQFIIHPPFYKTTWFIISSLFLSCFLIFLFFKIRVLSYNKDVVRELIRLLIKRIKRGDKSIIIREQGRDVKINTADILYVKAAGNYLDIYTTHKKYTFRSKIGEFINLVPDPLEYIRIHRSCIVRIDQVSAKSKNSVTINGEELLVSESYLQNLKKIQF